MNKELKKSAYFAGLLGVMFTIVIAYSIWGNLINKGTIEVTGEAPFTVEIFGGDHFQCDSSPCDISQKTGEKDLVITKPGFQTIVISVDVPLWKTAVVPVEFSTVPTISPAETIPAEAPDISYKLISENNKYKLVREGDSQERAIVYFSKNIKNPKIFGSDQMAIIIDQNATIPTAYKIDLIQKEKDRIEDTDFSNIEFGQWSPNGKYFYFIKNDELWILNDDNSVQRLSLTSANTKVAWTYQNTLFFVTLQDFQGGTPSNILSVNGLIFGEYDPNSLSFNVIDSFSEVTSLPEILVPAGNRHTIYFKNAEGSFKLTL